MLPLEKSFQLRNSVLLLEHLVIQLLSLQLVYTDYFVLLVLTHLDPLPQFVDLIVSLNDPSFQILNFVQVSHYPCLQLLNLLLLHVPFLLPLRVDLQAPV